MLTADMSTLSSEVVICGAGIAGGATAYHLAVRRGVRDIVIVDERPPLTLTSDKSAECYRNWWPGPGNDMVALMDRSVDLLEELAVESDNVFRLNRRGWRPAWVRRRRRLRSARGRCACTRRHRTTTGRRRSKASSGPSEVPIS